MDGCNKRLTGINTVVNDCGKLIKSRLVLVGKILARLVGYCRESLRILGCFFFFFFFKILISSGNKICLSVCMCVQRPLAGRHQSQDGLRDASALLSLGAVGSRREGGSQGDEIRPLYETCGINIDVYTIKRHTEVWVEINHAS